MFDLAAKFLDLVKASGWQNLMLSIAGALFIALVRFDYIDLQGFRLALLIAWAFLLICGALAFASLATWLGSGLTDLLAKWRVARRKADQRKAFLEDILFMTIKEKQILGYLREKKLRRFDADQDGGYAASLIAKGYVRVIAAPGGQFVHPHNVPMEVADYVWQEVLQRPEEFPYQPEFSQRNKNTEVQPWRVPWGAR